MASQPQFRGPFGPLAFAALLACAPATSSPDETSGQADTDTESGSTTDTGEPSECAPIAVEVGDAPGAQSLELLFEREDIPGIADQPTTRGQLLGTLHAFDGRLHLGYGDYSENTGPIAMNAWDPGEGAWVYLGTLATEEVQWFRPFGEYLLVPSTDPDAHQGEGGVYRLPCGGLWDESTTIAGAVHVYDVAIQGDTIYAGTGSLTAEPAQLMASTNLGDTWQEVLRKDSEAEKFFSSEKFPS